jgi:hypothetical protein
MNNEHLDNDHNEQNGVQTMITTEVERKLAQDLTRAWVGMEALITRAESDIAAGRDLGIMQEDRDMLSEQLADQIEDMARLRGY